MVDIIEEKDIKMVNHIDYCRNSIMVLQVLRND